MILLAIGTTIRRVVYKNANSLKSRTVAASVRQKKGKTKIFAKILIGIFIFLHRNIFFGHNICCKILLATF
jgi:hypothetical protein